MLNDYWFFDYRIFYRFFKNRLSLLKLH